MTTPSKSRDLLSGVSGNLGPRAWLRVERAPIALFLAGVVLSAGIFAWGRERDEEWARAALERETVDVANALKSRLDLPLEVLQSIASLFDASNEVTRADFAAFVADALARHRGIRAIEWILIVPANERSRYERAAEADGLRGFVFRDVGADGKMVPARDRPEHLPIYFMEPPESLALGFDVASEATRRAPMDRARELRAPVASPRIRLVEDPPTLYSIAVFHPVLERKTGPGPRAVRGFSAEVFRMPHFAGPAFEQVVRRGLTVTVRDETASPDEALLYESAPGVARAPVPPGGRRASVPIRFAERTWRVELTAPSAAALGGSGPRVGLLASGVATSALLAALVAAFRTVRALRRRVDESRTLGQYTLLAKLGQGGMGAVYEARHALLRRPTAIKLLPPTEREPERIARFEREVQATSQLTHPNTIAIYDYGRTPDGIFYYAMELLDGLTFEDLVRLDGPVPPSRAVDLLLQICGALAEAHEAGIVHRDVKPANLMVTERGGIADFVKVLDFGLVKHTRSPEVHAELSTAAGIVGTPDYMAPEMITGGTVDGRADLYSLGGVAYFLLTGTPVFEGRSLVETCAHHLHTAPPPPSRRSPTPLPPELDAVVLHCLAKAPADRPQSALALREALVALRPIVGSFADSEAHAWWRERGRALVARRRALRSADAEAPTEDARSVVVDLRPEDRVDAASR